MKNVILLTIDTLRRDVLGCYGNESGLTPFLDSLTDKCIVFNRHMSVGPYTQASFPGILAGSYFLEYGDPRRLSGKRTLISEVVKRGGFKTAAFHSNPYLSDFVGWNRGWDKFYDSMQDQVTDQIPYIQGAAINDKVKAWLGDYVKQPDRKPLFLWTHYMDIHEPYIPDQKYVDQIDASIKLTADEMFQLFKDVIVPRDISNSETVDLLRKLYEAHIIEVDQYVKQFFENLEELGLLEDSIVIITTDHGDEFGDHGSLSHDGKMTSELINVPLMIYDASLTEGKVVDTVVSGADIPSTIAHLFGQDSPETFHGTSLLPLDEYISQGAFGEAIGKLSHKVTETDRPVHFYQEDNLRITHRIEEDLWAMYDLADDPAEQNNIIESSPQAEEMKNKLRQRITWHDIGNAPVTNVTTF